MPRFLTTIVALLASLSIHASEIKTVKLIGQTPSVNACIKQFKSNNIECLDDIVEQSESLLNKTYNDKLNEIKKSDLNSVWMGNEKQKEDAIGLFIENQKKWIDYRQNYCTVALWKVQNSQHLGENQTSCKLNMNKRRIEEINLIGFE